MKRAKTHRGWHRMLAVVGAAVLVVVSAPVASAEPFLGTVETATTSFKVEGSEKNPFIYDITIAAERASMGGSQQAWVTVTLEACRFNVRQDTEVCRDPITHTNEISADAFSVDFDGAGASLDAELAGVPLQVTWTGSDGARVVSDSSGSYVRVGNGSEGTASVSLFDLRCGAPTGEMSHVYEANADRETPEITEEEEARPRGLGQIQRRVPQCVEEEEDDDEDDDDEDDDEDDDYEDSVPHARGIALTSLRR